MKLDFRGSLLLSALAVMSAMGSFFRSVPAIAPVSAQAAQVEPPRLSQDEDEKTKAPKPASSAPSVAPEPSASAEQKSKAPATSENQTKCECHFYQALMKSFGSAAVHPSCSSEQLADGTAPSATNYAAVLKSMATPPQIVLATVPDPIDSGLADQYDSVVEAIDTSLESEGSYARDHFWVPWRDVAAPGDPQALCRFRLPGVIVHLPRRAHDPPILTLLVGETPTWGVHKAALWFGLEFTQLGARPAKRIAILGPSYTGAAHSIRGTLREWHAQPKRADTEFDVVTGSATSVDVEDILGPVQSPGRHELPGTFRLTVAGQRDLECVFYSYLHDAQGVPGQRGVSDRHRLLHGTALLVESSTGFGDAQIDYAKAPEQPGALPQDRCDYDPELTLPFPLHISRVRNAYAVSEAPSHLEIGQVRVPDVELKPDLSDRNPPRDVEPTLSERTTVSHDTQLGTIFSTLSQHRVQYVGVAATDAADIVFLGEQIHKLLPDVRLFVFGANALYQHPSYLSALYGTFLVSPYAQMGSGSFRDFDLQRFFPSEAAAGVFKAARWLGSAPSGPSAGSRGRDNADGAMSNEPPLIWISAIGVGAVRPLAVGKSGTIRLDALAATAQTAPLGMSPALDRPAPQAWTLVVVVASIAAWLAARSYLLNSAAIPKETLRGGTSTSHGMATSALAGLVARVLAPSADTNPHIMRVPVISMPPDEREPFVDAPDSECPPETERYHGRLAVESAFYHLVTLTIPASVLIVVASVTFLAWLTCWHLAYEQTGVLVIQLALPLLAAIKLVPACTVCLRAWWRQRPRDDHAPSRRTMWMLPADRHVFYFFGCLLLQLAFDPFLALLAGALTARRLSYATFQLFVDRLTDVTSGLSPITVLIMGAAFLYVWGRCNLGRIRGCRDVETNMGSQYLVSIALAEPTAGQPPTPLSRAERLLFVEMHDPVRSAAYQTTLAVTFVAAIALFVLKPPTSLETRWTHVAIIVVMTIVICLTVSTMMHGALLLSRVTAFLRRLARHTIAESLHRVPPHLKRKVGDRIAEFRDHVAELETALSLLEGLHRSEKSEDGERVPAPHHIRRDLDRAIQLFEMGPSTERREVVRRVLTGLVTGAGQITLGLKPRWLNAQSETREADLATEEERKAFRAAQTRRRAAERYVACIVVILVGRMMGLFRYFMLAGTAGGLTLLLMVSTYPIQPHRLLTSAAACLTVAAILLNLAILLQLERDEVVSRISGTSIGRVDVNGEVLSRIFVLVVIPALSVVAVQFPRASATVAGWLDPVLRSFH